MWEVIARFFSTIILYSTGYIILKGLIKSNNTKMTWKTIVVIIIASASTLLVATGKYNIATPILSYLILVIMYKIIFDITISKATIITGIFMILIVISETLLSPIVFYLFPNVEVARTVPWIMAISNIATSILAYIISKIKFINNIYCKFFNKSENFKLERIITFILLTIMVLNIIFSVIANIYKFTPETIICFLAVIVFIILFILYTKEQNEYIYLYDQHNQLLEYVKEFETWVDTVEMSKHEYKNDLAVLETKISDPEIKNFISEKLTKKMLIDGDWMKSLKDLPSGGMKGLLYYKIVLAKNNKVEIKIDVSKTSKKHLLKLNKAEYKDLCQLFGIYLDNALEAAHKSRQKSMSVEIYELHHELNIVISNSFSGQVDLSQVSKKGYSTKGKGHGKGLHFAENILKQRKNFKTERKICNNFYIQKLIIENNKSKP